MKQRPAVSSVTHGDGTAVGLHDRLAGRQADAGGHAVARGPERLEHALPRAAGSTPGPASDTLTTTRPGRDATSTRTGAPAGECRAAFSSRLVTTWSIWMWSARTGGRSSGASTLTTRPSRSRAERAVEVRTRSVDVDRLAVGRERAGLDPAQAQQVGDDAVEPLGLVDHQAEQLGAGRLVVRRARPEVGGDGADRGQRGPQVVGDRGQQGAALAVDLLERLPPLPRPERCDGGRRRRRGRRGCRARPRPRRRRRGPRCPRPA